MPQSWSEQSGSSPAIPLVYTSVVTEPVTRYYCRKGWLRDTSRHFKYGWTESLRRMPRHARDVPLFWRVSVSTAGFADPTVMPGELAPMYLLHELQDQFIFVLVTVWPSLAERLSTQQCEHTGLPTLHSWCCQCPQLHCINGLSSATLHTQ